MAAMYNGKANLTGEGYAPKLDIIMSEGISQWWNGLSKNELLQYIAAQPNITADDIRRILANENTVLEFGAKFATASCDAVTNFYDEKE